MVPNYVCNVHAYSVCVGYGSTIAQYSPKIVEKEERKYAAGEKVSEIFLFLYIYGL